MQEENSKILIDYSFFTLIINILISRMGIKARFYILCFDKANLFRNKNILKTEINLKRKL